jgi:hypothetical protein
VKKYVLLRGVNELALKREICMGRMKYVFLAEVKMLCLIGEAVSKVLRRFSARYLVRVMVFV